MRVGEGADETPDDAHQLPVALACEVCHARSSVWQGWGAVRDKIVAVPHILHSHPASPYMAITCLPVNSVACLFALVIFILAQINIDAAVS